MYFSSNRDIAIQVPIGGSAIIPCEFIRFGSLTPCPMWHHGIKCEYLFLKRKIFSHRHCQHLKGRLNLMTRKMHILIKKNIDLFLMPASFSSWI